MKTSLQGLNCSLRYPTFLYPFSVRKDEDEEIPYKPRTFGQSESEICAEESSHVGANSSNTRLLR